MHAMKTAHGHGWGIRLAGSLACSLALLAGAGVARAQKPALLEIEGKDVRQVVLIGDRPVTLDEPASTIPFPAGSYRSMTITVGEKDSKNRYVAYRLTPFTAQEGQVLRVKAGAPLKGEVTVQRTGRWVTFHYLLTGQGDESYSAANYDAPKPAFKIFQGDELVESGKFEYG
jgi:hypothetical protein